MTQKSRRPRVGSGLAGGIIMIIMARAGIRFFGPATRPRLPTVEDKLSPSCRSAGRLKLQAYQNLNAAGPGLGPWGHRGGSGRCHGATVLDSVPVSLSDLVGV